MVFANNYFAVELARFIEFINCSKVFKTNHMAIQEQFIDTKSLLEPIILGSSHGGFYYDLFYLLAFLIATGWLVFEGIKRKINWVSWLLLLAFSRLFFIIGTKVAAYSLRDWKYLFYHLDFVPTSSKIVIGGMFFGLIAFWIAIKAFRLPLKTFDTLAFVVPVSIAVQRMGCFIFGCCFGLPTDLSWGVRYSFGTLPHFHQARVGLIDIPSTASLPVHPFPLYEALNCIFVVLILLYLIKKTKFKGSLLALSMAIWSGNRTLLEFFRDPSAHGGNTGEIILGLKLMQWLLLFTMVVAFSTYIYSRKKPIGSNNYTVNPDNHSVLIILMISTILVWYLRNWLQPVELFALNVILFPAILLTGAYLFKEITIPSYKWLTLSFLVLPMFLMSQTWEPEENKKKEKSSYHSVKTGFGSGNIFTNSTYKQYYYSEGGGTGCNGEQILPGNRYYLDYDNFKHSYWAFAAGYSKTHVYDQSEFTYGLDFIYGGYKETKMTDIPTTVSRKNIAFRPNVKFDSEWYGIGAGLLVGNLNWVKNNQPGENFSSVTRHSKETRVLPSFYGRVGPEKYFFADLGYGNFFPSPVPGMMWEAGLGSGFGLPKGNKLRIGNTSFGTYIQGNVRLKESFEFTGTYIGSKTNWIFIDNSVHNGFTYYEIKNNRQFMLGFKYNFPQ